MIVALYLAAIVAANLTVAWIGPTMSIVNAFLFIGLDLTARDRLHDEWHGHGLVPKMAALIGTGAALSYLLNRDAGRIALASLIAFAVSGAVDAAAYHFLRLRPRWQRMNGSNIPSALADSLIFPTVAFGGFLPLVVIGQFTAKSVGGALWSILLGRNSNYGRAGCDGAAPAPKE